MSSSIIENICSLDVNQDITLPSDHAPFSIVIQAPHGNLDSLRSRAMMLGDHVTLHNKQSSNLLRKPIRFSAVDAD